MFRPPVPVVRLESSVVEQRRIACLSVGCKATQTIRLESCGHMVSHGGEPKGWWFTNPNREEWRTPGTKGMSALYKKQKGKKKGEPYRIGRALVQRCIQRYAGTAGEEQWLKSWALGTRRYLIEGHAHHR